MRASYEVTRLTKGGDEFMGDLGQRSPRHGFWSTVPGLITAIGTLLGAAGGACS